MMFWTGASTEEESRAYLQARLTVYANLMFWAFSAMILFMIGLYWFFSPPINQDIIYGVSAGGLALLAFLWRGLLVRRTLSLPALFRIDAMIIIGAGTTLGADAFLAWNRQSSATTCLVYFVFTLFTRVIVVPSTGRHTFVVSALALIPIAIATTLLALWPDAVLDIPRPAFAAGAILLCSVGVLLAAAGSRIIYGLQQKVTAAQQLGMYKLDQKIGEGGMGAVYRAHHMLLRRPTAVKLLRPDKDRPDDLERFEREVRSMSQLTHPNTVAVFDYGRSNGQFYYAMEYLGGGIDLERLVRAHGPQPSGRVAAIMEQVCGALSEAHAFGLIHRDIKPPNIILCERGLVPDVAKVVDYGLVKEFTRDDGKSMQTILGTPAYLAPEAITSPQSVGPATDLYALGAVGFYLLTGKRVFDGVTAVELCIQHVTQPPKRPSEVAPVHVAPELEAIIMRCLAKKPEERFASAADLAAALRALPPAKDWDVAAATQWWADFKRKALDSPADATAPTITVTIDIGQRADATVTVQDR